MKFALVAFALIFCTPARGGDDAIAGLFASHGVEGTMVISSLRSGQSVIHNEHRAAMPFAAASTFKVLNTLIGLDAGVVSDKDSVFKWDGRVHGFPDWNRDQTLESAFKVSCVWCYQQLAQQVGAEKYSVYLDRAQYGHLSEPFDPVTFWLDGSLQISALEQVAFLKKLYLRSLPFRPASYDTLKTIMLAESGPAYRLFAKTGWAVSVSPQVGWYVGYVEASDEVWVFATNITIRDESDLPLRVQLTREALQAKGIIRH